MQHPERWNVSYANWVSGNDGRTTWKRLFVINGEVKITREIYKDKISFATRSVKSDINSTVTEAWFRKQMKQSALQRQQQNWDQFLSCHRRYWEHNEFVPLALQTFIKELLKSPVKQNSLLQGVFPASKPRTALPLLFGLAICYLLFCCCRQLNVIKVA